jgi:hypothetical protein
MFEEVPPVFISFCNKILKFKVIYWDNLFDIAVYRYYLFLLENFIEIKSAFLLGSLINIKVSCYCFY